MREKNKSWLREAWDDLRASCGFAKSRREQPTSPRTRQVEVHIQLTSGDRTVGFLSMEGSHFVFRYDPEYAKDRPAEPISAFPDLTREYRSDQLWPFFESRLPPVEREDVKQIIASQALDPDDVLGLLLGLSARTIASPYELRAKPSRPTAGSNRDRSDRGASGEPTRA
jgi:HipA-like protein